MSNNRIPPSPCSTPFLIVEYEKEKAVIGRNKNYQETLVSIKKAFNALKNTPGEDIIVKAHIEEADDNCRIIDEMWSELLPRLAIVQVTVYCQAGHSQTVKQPSEPIQSEEQIAAGVTIHVHRRWAGSWNWNNPVIQTYSTRIPLHLTVGQLIDQVKQQENIVAATSLLRYNSTQRSQETTLADCGIESNSVVETLMK